MNSTPRSSPRTAMPASARTTSEPEIASQSRRRFIRSGPLCSSHERSRPLPVMPDSRGRRSTQLRRTSQVASTRAMTSADTIEATTPIASVTPKPLTDPDARKNSSAAASSVVTFESMIALHALSNPASSARRRRPASALARLRWTVGVRLPRPFEDQDVGVDREADREHEAGEARQGERGADRDEHGVGDERVRRERDARGDADETVDDADVERGEGQADDGGLHRRGDRVGAEGRAHRALLDDLDVERQRAAADQRRELLRLVGA